MNKRGEIFSEAQALRLAQQGDPAAFEYLYRRHSPRVFALCLRMVKNRAHAEDLTQDTFLAVFRGLRDFRGQSAFSTWLHRVARNTVLMGFRKRRPQETSLDEFADSDSDTHRTRTELGAADARLESIADRLLLRSAVARLSRGFRAALLLHDLLGYEHSEVAAILGCATGTSKSQLHKARLHVRKMLSKGARRNKIKTIQAGASSSLRRIAA